MKFLLFGTGDYYERYKKWFLPEDTLALIDNSPEKQNTSIDGIQVLPPKEGLKLPYDAIIILSFYIKDMKAQLIKLGVKENKIYHFYDLHGLIYRKAIRQPIIYYGDARKLIDSEEKTGKKIVLLSTDLTLGGPAIALFHAACILSNKGFQVLYASMIDGPLREIVLSKNIPVIIDHNLQIETMKESGWLNSFSLVICNTINFYVLLSDRDTSIPVIWWLHDSAFFYDGVNREILRNIDGNNLLIVSVGSVPEKAFRGIRPEICVRQLIYGVKDNIRIRKEGKAFSQKVHFVTIGYIESRKGQDILISAIKMLPEEIRRQADFLLVGQDSSLMAQEIKKNMANITGVTIVGRVNREQIDEILDKADVLVCPSREDPMPTVAAEAMMHGVPCLISDAVGTAVYIQDSMDGFVFCSEDTCALAEKLIQCIRCRQELAIIGSRSREIYERIFSMEVFERNLLAIVSQILPLQY
jgi:Glycosyltransferase